MPGENLNTIGRLLWLGAPWALVFARVSGLAWTAPGWSTSGLGGRFRLVLAATLTALVAPIASAGLVVPGDGASLVSSLFIELIVGAAMGGTASLVIAGARQAGEIVGAQAGLSPASLLDPEAGDGLNVLGHLYGWVALGVFLGLSGPTELVRALAESYQIIPIGGSSPAIGANELTEGVFAAVARSLALALRASSPPALALLVAGLALGLLGRASPSLQLVSLSLPVRTALGLTLAALGLVTLAATLGAAWESGFPFALGLGFGDGLNEPRMEHG